ncbi:HTH_Tnp_Tc3_2 domain-containing protein [Trichonephila clavipes]|nr:HTH_Tnp_Tc3_2 domain-containing protein [Trichonephila clavipes]
MGYKISDIAMKFGFSRTTISRVYREYRESDQTSNLQYCCSPKKIVQVRNQRQLMRIIKRDRRTSIPQIAVVFNTGPSASATVRTIQRNFIVMRLRSRRPNRVSLLKARQKSLRLAWVRQHRHWTVNDWERVA